MPCERGTGKNHLAEVSGVNGKGNLGSKPKYEKPIPAIKHAGRTRQPGFI